MPPIEATNLQELQVRFRQGASGYYTARNVNPVDLYDRQSQLGLRATQDLAERKPTDEIKRNLQARQADLLRFGKLGTDLSMTPLEDETLIRIRQGGPLPVRQRGQKLFVEGGLMEELHYAGLGTRLESPKPKFLLTAKDLVDGLYIFDLRTRSEDYSTDKMYQALAKQISAAGGFPAIKARFAHMNSLTLGDRIFIEKLYAAFEMARDNFQYSPEDFKELLGKLKYDIILNASSSGEIIDHFIERGFYGLNTNNLLFMKQEQFPMWYVAPDGTLIDCSKYRSQGNHGLIPLQSYVDRIKFMVQPQRRGFTEMPLVSTDYKAWMGQSSARLVRNVEDIAQIENPFDWSYIGLMAPEPGDTYTPMMFMKMALQKTVNPQKCGFLCSLAAGRNAVLEIDAAPEVSPADIQVININNNGFSNPLECDMSILGSAMADNLHPTFELVDWAGESAVLRGTYKAPQGDRNLYLPSRYVLHEPAQPIENLKDMLDIINALTRMSALEADPDKMRFAKEVLGIEIGR